MTFKRDEYSRPLPELLDGDDWEARNSGDLKIAYVDFKKREFVVPFMPGAAGELVRAHEAMHVKISPKKVKYVKDSPDFVTYQAVEDTRVNQALRLAGIQTKGARVWKKQEIEERLLQSPITPMRFAEALMATQGLDEFANVKECLEEAIPDRAEKIEEIVDDINRKYFLENEQAGDLSPFECVEKAVLELQKRIKEISSEAEQDIDRHNKHPLGKTDRSLTESFQFGASDANGAIEELPTITDEEAKEINDAIPWDGMDYYGSSPPGTMKIEFPKFDSVIKFKKVRSVKQTPSDEGVIPTRMHRYATDMKVFNRKGKRRAGAAVLVDVSGSMSLSKDQIEEIIRQSPASIVAIYSAKGDNGGILRVVAEKNRFFSPLNQGMGYSNIVDFQALEWLSNRPEKKKLWISDGLVTGKGDRRLDDYHIRKIVNMVRQHRIERVGDVKELIKKGILIDRAFDDGAEIADRNHAKVTKRR